MTHINLPIRLQNEYFFTMNTGRALTKMLSVWWVRHRTRNQLSKLDEHALGDIGITRFEALHESSKPFWKS